MPHPCYRKTDGQPPHNEDQEVGSGNDPPAPHEAFTHKPVVDSTAACSGEVQHDSPRIKLARINSQAAQYRGADRPAPFP